MIESTFYLVFLRTETPSANGGSGVQVLLSYNFPLANFMIVAGLYSLLLSLHRDGNFETVL